MQFLSMEWPEVEVDEFNPKQQDSPEPARDWSSYDILLLEHSLGCEYRLQWLEALWNCPRRPRTIFTFAGDDPQLARQAMEMGADYCLDKNAGYHTRLIQLTREALQIDDKPTITAKDLRGPFLRGPLQPVKTPSRCTSNDISIRGYDLTIEISKTPSSIVYLATRKSDQKQMVLKILDTHTHRHVESLNQFIQEYETVAKLRTENVVRIYDQGFTDRHVYIAMEYLPNSHLRAPSARGNFGPEGHMLSHPDSQGLGAYTQRGDPAS